MTTKVGINGFGRIGRLAYRAMLKDPDIEIVAVNAPGAASTIAQLVKYDSVQGRIYDSVEVVDNTLVTDGIASTLLDNRDPSQLPWKELGVDVVVESTGKFRDGTKARVHLDAGAKKVLISAPGTNVDNTIVVGVNDNTYDPKRQHIVSNASCTTNCLMPVVKVLLDTFGIKRGFMQTIHAYTSDQQILDHPHKDPRRARAAALSIIPTTTGAAKAAGVVLPEVAGKLDGFATRVPVPDGSLVDLSVELERETTVEEINGALQAAAEGPMKGVLQYETDPIVSCDIIGNPHSSIYDSLLTMVLGEKGNFAKCVAWYDNEWGYANRLRDMVKILL